jgi:uncharacterized paraquat-inducible protein A
MRYFAYVTGMVLQAAGMLLALTAAVIRLGGRPNSRLLLMTGIVCFTGGVLLKRVSRLKRCHRCSEKVERNATRCHRCGIDLPTSAIESLSQPFYRK